MNAKGKAIERGRVRVAETVERGDGSTVIVSRTYAGAAMVVYVKPAYRDMKPADIRRSFVRKCKELGVICTVAETAMLADWGEEVPSAYYCLSPGGDAFARLALHFAVKSYHTPIGVRIPNGMAKPGQFGGAGGDAGAKRTLAYTRSSAAEKRVLDERDRRSLQTAAQKARIEASELAELPQ